MSKTKKYNGKNNFKTKSQKGGLKFGKAKLAHTEVKTGVYGSNLKGVASTGLHKYNMEKNRYIQSQAKLDSTPSPKKQKVLAVFGRSAEQQKQKAEKALLNMYYRTRNSTTPTNSTKPNINKAFFNNLQGKKSAMETAYDKKKSEAYQAASTQEALNQRKTRSANLTTKQSELAQLYRKRNTLRKNTTGKTNRAAIKKDIENLQSNLKAHNLYSGPQSVASLKKEANKGVFSFIQNKFQGKNRIYKTLTPEKVSTLLNTKKAAEEKTIANLSQVSSGSPKVLTLTPTVTAATPSTAPSTKTSPATNNKTLLKKLSQLSAQVLTKDFAVKAAKAQGAYETQKGALTGIIDSQKITLIETSSPTQSYANTKKQIQGLGLKKEQENVLLAKFKIDKQQQLATIRTPTPTSIAPSN